MHGQQNIKLKQTINMETIRFVPTFDNHFRVMVEEGKENNLRSLRVKCLIFKISNLMTIRSEEFEFFKLHRCLILITINRIRSSKRH
jgi:hypothetical protein